MKRFYAKFRIALMTFTLGLAGVFVMNGSLQFSEEVSVNLPETKSESVILVYPKLAADIRIDKITACSRGKLTKLEENSSNHK